MSMSKTIDRSDAISSLNVHLRWYRSEAQMASAKGNKEYAKENRNIVKGLKLALKVVRRINGKFL
jgi:hypothetical protein